MQLPLAARLGTTPSFFINHIHSYGHRLSGIVGDERTARYVSVGSALAACHQVTLHSDNLAIPIGPFRVIRSAVLRIPRKSTVALGEGERLGAKTIVLAGGWDVQ